MSCQAAFCAARLELARAPQRSVSEQPHAPHRGQAAPRQADCSLRLCFFLFLSLCFALPFSLCRLCFLWGASAGALAARALCVGSAPQHTAPQQQPGGGAWGVPGKEQWPGSVRGVCARQPGRPGWPCRLHHVLAHVPCAAGRAAAICSVCQDALSGPAAPSCSGRKGPASSAREPVPPRPLQMQLGEPGPLRSQRPGPPGHAHLTRRLDISSATAASPSSRRASAGGSPVVRLLSSGEEGSEPGLGDLSRFLRSAEAHSTSGVRFDRCRPSPQPGGGARLACGPAAAGAPCWPR